MKNAYLIGDSHTLRLGNILIDNIMNRMGQRRIKPYSIQTRTDNIKTSKQYDDGDYLFINSNMHSVSSDQNGITTAAYLGRSALTFNYDMYEYMQDWDKKENVIMPWLGYIDIKNYIPNKNLKNYKNAQEVVEVYVNNTLKKFKNAKVIFVKPMPQFEVTVTARWKNFAADPAIEFEARHSAHLEFCEMLDKKCMSLGLEKPIDISEILGVPWIYTDMQYKKPIQYIYNDHCLPKVYNDILNYFIDNKQIVTFGP